MRTMYDAVSASNLPAGGDLYAGYVDGQWPDYHDIVARFPGKLVVAIATNPSTNNGVVGDGPPDNGTWPEWINWCTMRRAAGVDPSMNCSQANWLAGQTAFTEAGVTQPYWWISNYDNVPQLSAGETAKQYATNNSYDTSVVADYWPGVDPALSIPTPSEENDMSTTSVNGRAGLEWAAGAKHVIQVGASGAPDLHLNVELKFATGPWYASEQFVLVNGSSVYEIPADLVATCRGVILTLATGSVNVEYDVTAA